MSAPASQSDPQFARGDAAAIADFNTAGRCQSPGCVRDTTRTIVARLRERHRPAPDPQVMNGCSREFTVIRRLAILTLPLATMMPGAALAHHAIDGRTPATFAEGIISGLAHPVLGLDHLVFLLAAGLSAGALHLGIGTPLLFIAATVAGLAVHLADVTVPAAEAIVAISILALGLAAGSRSDLGRKVWIGLFVVAGLFHGYTYGESIVGATAPPLFGYLAGLALVQSLLTSGTYVAGSKLADGVGHARPEMRHLGALLAVIGVVFFVAALRTSA